MLSTAETWAVKVEQESLRWSTFSSIAKSNAVKRSYAQRLGGYEEGMASHLSPKKG